MKQLDRYIGKTVLSSCLVVMLTITGLDSLFAFIAELEDVSSNYPLTSATVYTLLTVPRRLIEYMPMSIMVGSLVGLGVLANGSELTVMRAAGISKYRILGSVMIPVLLLVLVSGVIGEYVAPKTEQAAIAKRAAVFGGTRAIGTKHGIWHREGKWFLHINAVKPDGNLLGVTLYEFNEQEELASAGFAQQVDYLNDNWVLKNFRITYFEENRTRVALFNEQIWSVSLEPELLSVLSVLPDNMSMRGLYRYSQYIEEQEIDASPYVLAFWKKFFLPLGIFALVLVAISSVFGSLRSVTMGQRIMVGVMIGIVFKIFQDLLGPASTVYGFSPLISALMPIFICFVAGSWLLRRSG
ncbi:LPS export ABC transporter permease LptG [Motiliproteus sp. MSK22-1]|uniref:LPS export ABC transporter permease LptG n=1 Tax=Motiliproteus sp. MSK22-1 TaxID=1897630 RepID=UPI000977DC9A|nr:LPS export ABC transporter permease LptG [Motiliproteus sp. MSK22-1]OMH38288.1 LPS export ABC transporter permease LptG [Motiliproteus sp. MSK22-1]